MIATFVTFELGDSFDEGTVKNLAQMSQGKFQDMPGLRSKTWTVDADKKQARNFYVWEEEAAARNFFSVQMLENVSKLYGVHPSIEYAEIGALVDNHSN